MQALSLMQHLYTPNTIILIFRLLSQIRECRFLCGGIADGSEIRAPAIIQPTRSMFALFSLVTVMNAVAALFHFLDFSSGMNGTKGVFLDFVGQGELADIGKGTLISQPTPPRSPGFFCSTFSSTSCSS